MKEIASPAMLQAELDSHRRNGHAIALVPTMGNLHDGHLRLVAEARRRAPVVAVSIFVNPLQFGENEDYSQYPRTPQADREALRDASVDVLFMPTERDMYPEGREAVTPIPVGTLGEELCGAFRPGHFSGVATVVHRLFQLVRPAIAVFGKKDYQQWVVIRNLVSAFDMPISVLGVETVREASGLALSSRNRYLDTQQHHIAARLYATLREVATRVFTDQTFPEIESWAMRALRDGGFRPDYVSIRRPDDLQSPSAEDQALIVLAAAWLGKTRLIDNFEFSRDTHRSFI